MVDAKLNPAEYWASLPINEIVPHLHNRVEAYYSLLNSSGHLDKIRKSYEVYHGLGKYDSSKIHQDGANGELLRIKINELRSHINHVLVLTSQNRSAFKAVAINSDFKSQVQAKLGDTLVDYYFKTKHYERIRKEAAELALVTSKGYVIMDWDVKEGTEYGATQDGKVIYDGDVTARAKSCVEVIEDPFADKAIWYIVRDKVNKYDLAAQFPEKAEDIINARDPNTFRWDFNSFNRAEQDLVWKYTFYHARTPAVPSGRLTTFLEGDIWLTDGPLPYEQLLVFPIKPGGIKGTQLGYTMAFDLLSLNDGLNSVMSSFVTNTDTFGVNNIFVKTGSNIKADSLAGGLNVIEADEKPEPINFASMPGEMFKVADMIGAYMGKQSGINDTVRGDPQANLKSGSALALVAAQAVAYNSDLQENYDLLGQDMANGLLTLLKSFATTPKMIAIVGADTKSMLKEFTGDDLQGIDRVVCETVSAISRTTAGKMELANNLLNQGLLKDAREYMTLIETGRIEPAIGDTVTESLLIRQENELLRDGVAPVTAVITEEHVRHIMGHRQVLSDPYAKLDPALVQRVLDHIYEHVTLALSPEYAQLGPIFGHPPVQGALMPGMPPQGNPAAPGNAGMGPPEGQGAPKQPKMPELPPGSPANLQPPEGN